MNTVIPALVDNTVPGTLIILGGLIFIGIGIVIALKTEAVGVGASMAFVGAVFGVGVGISYLESSGNVSTEAVLSEVKSHYGVVLEEHAVLPDFTDDSSFVTLDVINVYTNEVHEDARLVWNGVELTLLVKDDVVQEYVPMVSSE